MPTNRPKRPLTGKVLATSGRLAVSAAVGLLAIASLIAGCNIVAPAYLLIAGPEKVPAQHELEKARPTVVFIDDRSNRLPRRALRQTIGEEVQRLLLADRALTDVIDTRAAITVASQDRVGQSMSIVDIGRAVKAEVVIYATIDAFSLTTDGESYSPVATLRVKVVDVVTDKRIWPEEASGFPLTLTFPPRSSEVPRNLTEVRAAEDDLARRVGLGLAQLFMKYERTQGADEL